MTERASAPSGGTLRKYPHAPARGRVLRIESPIGCKPSLRSRRAGARTSSKASSRTRTASQHTAGVAPAGMDQECQTAGTYKVGPTDSAKPDAGQTDRNG